MSDLTFLGTAASVPSPERGLPAILISAGSERFLVDCGEGTQRQLLRSGTGFRRLGDILLTHLHLDHVLGLAGLLSTLRMFDISGALTIHGSRETIGFVAQYLGGIWPGGQAPVEVRLVVLDPGVLEPGPVFAGRGYRVTCFPVRHHQTQSLGYLFETTSRRHLHPERLAALGIPPGPLRARLAAGEPVVLEDGREIAPEDVEAEKATATRLAVVGDTQETETLAPFVAGADALVIEGDVSRPGSRTGRAARPLDGRAGRPAGPRCRHRVAVSDAHLGRYWKRRESPPKPPPSSRMRAS